MEFDTMHPKKEIDILERHILAAISKCSIFEFNECKKVYLRAKSFDKTIEILKQAVEQKKSPHIIMDDLGIKRP